MKIALVQCPSWTVLRPPYNLAVLSSCLKESGHDVICFDFNINMYNHLLNQGDNNLRESLEESSTWYRGDYVQTIIKKYDSYIDFLVNQILESDAKIIGFTIVGTTRYFSEEIASRIKKKDPKRIIVFGGYYCFRTEVGIRFLEKPFVDAVCLGEAEFAFPSLIKEIEINKGRLGYCKGFAYRDKENRAIDCGDYPLVEDLDCLRFADFSGFNLDEYPRKSLAISTSRGCINRCSFCAESRVWRKYRLRSAYNIYREIVFQLTNYPKTEFFFFNDSLINGNIELLDQICDLIIENKVRVGWGGQGLIRKEMDLRLLKKMREAGFVFVSYGLESASPRILRLMKKGYPVELAGKVIRNTKRVGVSISVNIIVGYPSETEEDLLMTLEFLKRNMDFIDNVCIQALVVLPGSFLYINKDDLGISFPEDNDINRWYTIDGRNDFKLRLERMEFCKRYLEDFGHKVSLVFPSSDHLIRLAEEYESKKDFDKALEIYQKAIAINKDINKDLLIEGKIAAIKKFLKD